MGHFAKVDNGTVIQVIVADQGFIDSGAVGNPADWVQTSYNTRAGVHFGTDGQPDNGVALRGNYAGIGHIYDAEHDVFYSPRPFPSWTISTATNWLWAPPVPMPDPVEGAIWLWDEDTLNWISQSL
jgi:hypothetical protein